MATAPKLDDRFGVNRRHCYAEVIIGRRMFHRGRLRRKASAPMYAKLL
jgi:hypothetical protein